MLMSILRIQRSCQILVYDPKHWPRCVYMTGSILRWTSPLVGRHPDLAIGTAETNVDSPMDRSSRLFCTAVVGLVSNTGSCVLDGGLCGCMRHGERLCRTSANFEGWFLLFVVEEGGYLQDPDSVAHAVLIL